MVDLKGANQDAKHGDESVGMAVNTPPSHRNSQQRQQDDSSNGLANQNMSMTDSNNYPVSSDQEESKYSAITTQQQQSLLLINNRTMAISPHQSSSYKQPRRSIFEEEMERISQANQDEEAYETDYCIKGYDFMSRTTYNQYTVLKSLADSRFTNVCLCQQNSTLERLVMKQLRRGQMRKTDRQAYIDAMREIDIHKMLNHPNIVKLREVIDDDAEDKVYLIMDYASQGQLMYHNKKTN